MINFGRQPHTQSVCQMHVNSVGKIVLNGFERKRIDKRLNVGDDEKKSGATRMNINLTFETLLSQKCLVLGWGRWVGEMQTKLINSCFMMFIIELLRIIRIKKRTMPKPTSSECNQSRVGLTLTSESEMHFCEINFYVTILYTHFCRIHIILDSTIHRPRWRFSLGDRCTHFHCNNIATTDDYILIEMLSVSLCNFFHFTLWNDFSGAPFFPMHVHMSEHSMKYRWIFVAFLPFIRNLASLPSNKELSTFRSSSSHSSMVFFSFWSSVWFLFLAINTFHLVSEHFWVTSSYHRKIEGYLMFDTVLGV